MLNSVYSNIMEGDFMNVAKLAYTAYSNTSTSLKKVNQDQDDSINKLLEQIQKYKPEVQKEEQARPVKLMSEAADNLNNAYEKEGASSSRDQIKLVRPSNEQSSNLKSAYAVQQYAASMPKEPPVNPSSAQTMDFRL